ncbi:DUF455 domain-containing protein, partial [Burkholderia sp. Ac-20353]|nr:DUF455 domain-containing protein [Burkholderia sp. Ac-20353]
MFSSSPDVSICVRRAALAALREPEPAAKAAQVRALHDAQRAG